MQTLDIILLILFILPLIQGLRKGFTAQVMGLISVIVGLWAAFKFSAALGQWLGPRLGGSGLGVQIIAFVVILIVVILILRMLGKGLEELIKLALLGWLDRLLGLLLSLTSAALLIGAILILFEAVNSHTGWISQETLDQSLLFRPLQNVVYAIFPFFKSLLVG